MAIGSSLVGEGETAQRSEELLAGIEQDKKRLAEWGVQDIEKALLNRFEHAGIDVEHAQFGVHVVREYVDTPELQDEMRRVFLLRFYSRNVRD